MIIVGLGLASALPKRLYAANDEGEIGVREVGHINAYLTAGANVIVEKASYPPDERAVMLWGNKPADGGHLLLSASDRARLLEDYPTIAPLLRPFLGADEVINGLQRYALWIGEVDLELAEATPPVAERLHRVGAMRRLSNKASTRAIADTPHRYAELRQRGDERTIVVPGISSENRPYLPCGILEAGVILSNKNYALYDSPLWNLALVAYRLHWVWIGTVCVRMRTDFSYSNTLGWNTFPVPKLTEQDKADLTRCAEDILLAREAHFPATIADLYDPEAMPEHLRRAHDANDEVLERIYIGRRFRNDTERLEKLFELYTRMTADAPKPQKGSKAAPVSAAA